MRSLTSIVEDNLGFLVDEFGFSLTTRNYGKEIEFEFERGLKTISIFIEMGSRPRVRIYGPVSQFGGEIVPSAEKMGINRGMRCVKPGEDIDASDDQAYFQNIAVQLLKNEREWLEL